MVAVAVGALPGCAENGEAPAIEPPAVDPRYATADAFVEYYNELTFNRQAVDAERVLDLLYGETAQQQRLIDVIRNYTSVLQLGQAMWDRFAEGWDAKVKVAPLAPNLKTTVITEHSGQRAMAKETNSDGSESDLYLVRIGDRWWISGYTLEYDPHLEGLREELKGFEILWQNMAAVAPAITERLRNGEFNAAAEVRAAIGEALVAQLGLEDN